MTSWRLSFVNVQLLTVLSVVGARCEVESCVSDSDAVPFLQTKLTLDVLGQFAQSLSTFQLSHFRNSFNDVPLTRSNALSEGTLEASMVESQIKVEKDGTFHNGDATALDIISSGGVLSQVGNLYESSVPKRPEGLKMWISPLSWVFVLATFFVPGCISDFRIVQRIREGSVVTDSVAEDLVREEKTIDSEIRPFRWQYLLFLCILYVMSTAGMTAFSASFNALEVDTGLSPAEQGALLMVQSLAIALSSILWGIAADGPCGCFYVLGIGNLISCVGTIATAFLAHHGPFALAAARCCFGFGCGSIRPIVQRFIADIFPEHEVGTAFACTMASASLGFCISTPLVAYLSNTAIHIPGAAVIRGWEFSFVFLGILGATYTILIFRLAANTPYAYRTQNEEPDSYVPGSLQIRSLWLSIVVGVCVVTYCETHVLLVAWTQYFSDSDLSAGGSVSAGLIAAAVGSILGGILADMSAFTYPLHGRIFVGEAGTILTMVSWTCLVMSTRSAWWFTSASFFMLGFTKLWSYVAVRALMLPLIPPKVISSFLGIVEVIEGGIAALAGPFLVGILADRVFGYIPKDKDMGHVSRNLRLNNTYSLGAALSVVNIATLFIALAALALLHITYPVDKQHAQAYSVNDNNRLQQRRPSVASGTFS